MTVRVVPDSFALLAVDPGKKTGVAAGVFRPTGDPATAKATLRRAVRKNMVWATVLGDRPEIQAHKLAATWTDFRFRATVELGIAEPDVFLLIEDFQLRQMAVDLVPVEVVAGLRAVQYKPAPGWSGGWADDVPEGQLIRFSASEAKGYATNDRLKLWRDPRTGRSVYDLGRGRGYSDHARDALRHVCLGVSKALDGKLSERGSQRLAIANAK